MKNEYENYQNINKDILDIIKTGDLVKCNNWKSPIRVVGVSENYFIMATNKFGNCLYSICEKKQSQYGRNSFSKGNFRIGTDNYVFGNFDYLNKDDVIKALEELEKGIMELSVRKAVNLYNISVKRV